jgi:hypothetical protein
MPTTLDALYNEFVISSFDKQLRLADAHGEDVWGFDMDRGEITFDDAVSYKVQILGTEDHAGGSWMWGWANTASDIPEELLVLANELRSHGEQHSITQLTTAKLPLEALDGQTVGLIAGGFANGVPYYRCPYDNGALFVLITDPRLKLTVENKLVRAARVIPESISSLEIGDHRHAIAAYCRQNGFDAVDDAGKLLIRVDGETMFTAEFDELGRLSGLEGTIPPTDGN